MNPNVITKKIRRISLKNIRAFINIEIENTYQDIGNKSFLIKKILPINNTILSHSNCQFDKEFLNMKLKDILSQEISHKFTVYPPEKNKMLIEYLINNSEKRGEYFKELFDLTFLDCLEHIRGSKHFDILNGLMTMEDMLNNEHTINDDELDVYKYYFHNYELYINYIKPRKSKSKIQKQNK